MVFFLFSQSSCTSAQINLLGPSKNLQCVQFDLSFVLLWDFSLQLIRSDNKFCFPLGCVMWKNVIEGPCCLLYSGETFFFKKYSISNNFMIFGSFFSHIFF